MIRAPLLLLGVCLTQNLNKLHNLASKVILLRAAWDGISKKFESTFKLMAKDIEHFTSTY